MVLYSKPLKRWDEVDMYLEEERYFLTDVTPLISRIYHKELLRSYFEPTRGIEDAKDFQQILYRNNSETLEEASIFERLEILTAQGHRIVPAMQKESEILKSLREKLEENEKILGGDKTSLTFSDFSTVVNNFSSLINYMDYRLGFNELRVKNHTEQWHPMDVVHKYERFLDTLYRTWDTEFRIHSSIPWGFGTFCLVDSQGSILPRISGGEPISIIYYEIPDIGLKEGILRDVSPIIKDYLKSRKVKNVCVVSIIKERSSKEKFDEYLKKIGAKLNYTDYM